MILPSHLLLIVVLLILGLLLLVLVEIQRSNDRRENEEMFGTQRLVDTLNAQADGSPQQLISRVYDEVGKFVGDAPQFDDLTMLCLEYR